VSDPVIARKEPFEVEVEAGKRYFWCTCGQSKNQPFCDGAHTGSDFRPHVWTADEAKTIFFCGCKHTKDAPFCDGSHGKL